MELSAFVNELQAWEGGCDVVPLHSNTAFSSGRMAARDYEFMRDQILAPLRAAQVGCCGGLLRWATS